MSGDSSDQIPAADPTQATWAATSEAWSSPPAEPAPSSHLPPRYTDRGLIGQGGNGEVRRVHDEVLRRDLAMKLLLPSEEWSAERMARLREEAILTARLQHPGIVPVHDCGTLPDGRVWFTMKEIRGTTLDRAIQAIPSGEWTQRSLVSRFVQVCQAVAFAHSAHITHRDLKPANIMLGEFGEVLVMDWGLAESTPPEAALPAGQGRRRRIEGTPVYMAPEQARGEPATPATDVYALGAVLYTILCGRAPYRAAGREALAAVLAGPPRPLSAEEGPPPDLIAACQRAMARAPAERGTVRDLLDGVQGWLDGVQRREQALVVVAQADALQPAIQARRQGAADLRARAEEVMKGVQPHSPLELKEPAWDLEDAAGVEERQARLDELVWQQTLRSALNMVEDLPEAHERLADHYRTQLEAAEIRRDSDAIAASEWLLRQHDRGRHRAYLKGTGAVTLVTDPPGAEVRLHRYVEHRRRLVPEFIEVMGRTPLDAVSLEPGSYLLTLHLPGHEVVRYPVFIERQAHWHGIRPGDTSPYPIHLPRLGELPPEVAYVPAGWFIAGGDPDATDSLPRQWVWVDGFAIARHPVTNAQYLDFLNDLVAQGRADEAAQHQPLIGHSAVDINMAKKSYIYDGKKYLLGIDNEGISWQPDWPVTQVDWNCACKYTLWRSGLEKKVCRLPIDIEREKASRGADGRYFPWGNSFDAQFARVVDSLPGRPQPVGVEQFTSDESLYLVCGLSGNTRDLVFKLMEKARLSSR